MSILEKFIYAIIVFVGVYLILWLALDLFEIVSTYNAHLIGGFAAVAASVLLFMYLLIIKKDSD